MRRVLASIACATGFFAGLGIARASDTPFGKTFTGYAHVCSVRYGSCMDPVNIHVYVGEKGNVYSFLRSEGGEPFPLGQFRSFGNTQQRFLVSGNTLVFEDMFPFNGGTALVRGYLRAHSGACSITGSATLNGAPEPISMEAYCQVYEGHH